MRQEIPNDLHERFGDDLESAVRYLCSVAPPRPVSPKKPATVNMKSAKDVYSHAENWDAYELQMKVFAASLKKWQQENMVIESMIYDYIVSISGLDKVPDAYRKKVWDAAAAFHQDGYFAVYGKLRELVAIFLPAKEKTAKAVISSHPRYAFGKKCNGLPVTVHLSTMHVTKEGIPEVMVSGIYGKKEPVSVPVNFLKFEKI